MISEYLSRHHPSLLLEVLRRRLRELRLGLVREVLVDVLDDLGRDARKDLEEVVVRLKLLQQDVDVLLHRLCNGIRLLIQTYSETLGNKS